MRLTTKSEYSILAMIYIAREEKDGYIKSKDIAEKYNISRKYIESLLSMLKQKGLIKAKTGKNGGFKLAKSAKDIFLSEIIRTMDGAIAPIDSASKYFYEETALENEKKVMSVFINIRNIVAEIVEKTSLNDVL